MTKRLPGASEAPLSGLAEFLARSRCASPSEPAPIHVKAEAENRDLCGAAAHMQEERANLEEAPAFPCVARRSP